MKMKIVVSATEEEKRVVSDLMNTLEDFCNNHYCTTCPLNSERDNIQCPIDNESMKEIFHTLGLIE